MEAIALDCRTFSGDPGEIGTCPRSCDWGRQSRAEKLPEWCNKL